MPAENKYIFIVNQRHSNALNEMLADIREMRLTKDFDNSVFEKEMDESLVPELKMEDMELTVESMEEGIEYGNRAEYRTYQCRRFHTDGGYRIFLF